MQLLAEMCRIMRSPNLTNTYRKDWGEKWLKRLLIVCKRNLTGEYRQSAATLLQAYDDLPGIKFYSMPLNANLTLMSSAIVIAFFVLRIIILVLQNPNCILVF